MKIATAALFVLLVIGAGLFLTSESWMSLFTTAPTVAPPVVTYVPQVDMNKWNWTLPATSTVGAQFLYPNPLPTKYVTAEAWPPVVDKTLGTFTCTVGPVTGPDGLQKQVTLRTVSGRQYCTAISTEGAAGSTYTSYEYSTEQDDSVVQVAFTLRTPQCANYSEPERGYCTVEQGGFSVDGLADRIAESLRTL